MSHSLYLTYFNKVTLVWMAKMSLNKWKLHFGKIELLFDKLSLHCIIPENIHTSPMEGIFLRPPTPIKLHTFFKFFGLTDPLPIPQEIPIPSLGRVWIFSGTAQ